MVMHNITLCFKFPLNSLLIKLLSFRLHTLLLTIIHVFTFRLTSVAGLSYIFSDEERDASWCGSPGRPCLDCRGASDVSIFDQCADRIMCPILAEKLFGLLKKLQDCLDESSKCDDVCLQLLN